MHRKAIRKKEKEMARSNLGRRRRRQEEAELRGIRQRKRNRRKRKEEVCSVCVKGETGMGIWRSVEDDNGQEKQVIVLEV